LARSIEVHGEEISQSTIRHIRQDAEVPGIAKLSDRQLHEWASGILTGLQSWLIEGADQNVVGQFQNLGRLRFEKSIPLHESIRCLHAFKRQILDFTRNRGFAQSAIEVYAQEELEHRVGLFFDWLVYYVVRGYEDARAHAARSAA
jgi:hypothetical protein